MKKILALALVAALCSCDLLAETGSSSSDTGSSSSSNTSSSSISRSSSSSSLSSATVNSDLQDVYFTLGGSTSTNPSYLDADLMQTYSGSALNTNNMPLIDLVFNDGKIYSATESSRITKPAQSWFIRVPVSYESIHTQSQVVDLYNKYSAQAVTNMTPKTGDVIVIYTSEQRVRLMKIENYSATDLIAVGARVKF